MSERPARRRDGTTARVYRYLHRGSAVVGGAATIAVAANDAAVDCVIRDRHDADGCQPRWSSIR